MTQQPPHQITSWQEAERNAERWMRHWGFTDARITSGGADGGVDVRARSAVAQVKFEASQVGRPALQRLYGARGARHDQWLVFFTGAGYSAQALAYADSVGMALFLYRLDGTMTAMNVPARTLMKAAEDRARGRAAQASARSSTPSAADLFERRGAERKTPTGHPMPGGGPSEQPHKVSGAGAAIGAFCAALAAIGAASGTQPLWYRMLAGAVWALVGVAFVARGVQVQLARGRVVRPEHVRYGLLLLVGLALTALAAAIAGEPGALGVFLVSVAAAFILVLLVIYRARHGRPPPEAAQARTTSD